MIHQDELRKWLNDYWGLELIQNGGSRSIPHSTGAWTTGWTVSGRLPGCPHSCYWFRTLKEVAERFNFKK